MKFTITKTEKGYNVSTPVGVGFASNKQDLVELLDYVETSLERVEMLSVLLGLVMDEEL